MNSCKTHIVRQPACLGVALGRKFALWDCVREVPSLSAEFRKAMANIDIHTLNTDEYADMVAKFVKDRGLHVVDETPILKIDGDRYHVDIAYRIAW